MDYDCVLGHNFNTWPVYSSALALSSCSRRASKSAGDKTLEPSKVFLSIHTALSMFLSVWIYFYFAEIYSGRRDALRTFVCLELYLYLLCCFPQTSVSNKLCNLLTGVFFFFSFYLFRNIVEFSGGLFGIWKYMCSMSQNSIAFMGGGHRKICFTSSIMNFKNIVKISFPQRSFRAPSYTRAFSDASGLPCPQCSCLHPPYCFELLHLGCQWLLLTFFKT